VVVELISVAGLLMSVAGLVGNLRMDAGTTAPEEEFWWTGSSQVRRRRLRDVRRHRRRPVPDDDLPALRRTALAMRAGRWRALSGAGMLILAWQLVVQPDAELFPGDGVVLPALWTAVLVLVGREMRDVWHGTQFLRAHP
jgi:hypothetical protein